MTSITDQIQSDLAAMMGDWGDSMVANPRTDKAVTISGIYTRAPVETEEFSGYKPVFMCRKMDVAASGLKTNETVEVTSALHSYNKKPFKVVEQVDDGLVVQLVLHVSQ